MVQLAYTTPDIRVNPPVIMDFKELSSFTGLSNRTLRRRIKDGVIPRINLAENPASRQKQLFLTEAVIDVLKPKEIKPLTNPLMERSNK
ncbi:MAG: hypothetical protein P8L44_01150 [Opitutales bacterium]|jgi:hypothetical protein|nr:hypothetical protein [Opitutales bacterium]